MKVIKSVHLQARLLAELNRLAEPRKETVAAMVATALFNHYGIDEPPKANRSPSRKPRSCRRQSLVIDDRLEAALIEDAEQRKTTVPRLIQVLACESFNLPITCLNPSPKAPRAIK